MKPCRPCPPAAAALAAAALVLLCIWAGSAAASPAVRVQRVAAVDRAQVRLQDIAEPGPGMSPERWTSIGAETVLEAPTSRGEQRTFGRGELRTRLGRIFGSFVERFALPDRLILQRGGRVLDEQALHKLVLDSLRRKTQGLSGEVEFRDLRLPEHVFLRSGDAAIECQSASSIGPGRNSLWITVLGPQGERQRRLSGNVFIDLWRSVPCAARPIKRHEQLAPEAVTFERKNLAYLSYEIWDGQGGPWRMTRSVGTGQVLYARSLEPVPLISRGDQVTLCFQSEHVRLRVPALAMEDGGYGQTLRVRNLQSKKTVYATVEDQDTVLVE